jgi:hypothetical protein
MVRGTDVPCIDAAIDIAFDEMGADVDSACAGCQGVTAEVREVCREFTCVALAWSDFGPVTVAAHRAAAAPSSSFKPHWRAALVRERRFICGRSCAVRFVAAYFRRSAGLRTSS